MSPWLILVAGGHHQAVLRRHDSINKARLTDRCTYGNSTNKCGLDWLAKLAKKKSGAVSVSALRDVPCPSRLCGCILGNGELPCAHRDRVCVRAFIWVNVCTFL
jgi:hypothetical protein